MKTSLFRVMSPLWVVLGAWCLWSSGSVSVADLPEAIGVAQQKAAAEFTPLGPTQLVEAEQGVCRAAEVLEARLAEDGENGGNWQKYLRLDTLRANLDESGAANLEKLDEIYSRLNRDYEGLELVWFVDLKRALGRYLDIARSADKAEIETVYKELVGKTLPEQLEALRSAPSPAVAHDVGLALGWLTDFCQAGDLVGAVREQYVRPNLFIEVSETYLAAAAGGPIDEDTPICDVILGTTIQGTGKTKGQVAVELVPCEDKGIIETTLSGTTESDSTGHNGPVCIFSTGVTTFEGSTQMVITPEGIEATPAVSTATTASTITGICSRRGSRLVQRAAWRRVCQQKCQAEAIAAQHAECRLNGRIDGQAGKAADDANQRYEERFRQPLGERKVFAEDVAVSTTATELRIRALRAAYDQLAAPAAPPELAAPADIAVRVHQSVINNSAFTLLAGRTVTEESFLKTVEDILGEVPEELRPEEGKASWTIHFAEREPFTVTFGNGGYTIALCAAGYEREGKSYPGMNVWATYKIKQTDEGLVATRQGDIEVYPPGFVKGERQLSGNEQTIREMLKNRFAKVFGEKVVPKGYLEPKGRWAEKVGRVPLAQWSMADGWMTMAWKLKGEE